MVKYLVDVAIEGWKNQDSCLDAVSYARSFEICQALCKSRNVKQQQWPRLSLYDI